MSDPVFGIVFRKKDEEARPVYRADLSTIGLIGPAHMADPTVYPLNTPVKIESTDEIMAGYLGTDGYLPDALRGINDQLGEMQFAARVVIVRTALGTNPDPAIANQQTISNIVGNSLQGTGLWAFLKSVHTLGFTPRLIAAPGYTGLMANGVGTCTRTTAGAGYIEGHSYTATFSGGGSNAVQATGHVVGLADGSVGPMVLDTPGAWYDTTPSVAIAAPPTGVRATYSSSINSETGQLDALVQTEPGMGYYPDKSYTITMSGGGGETQATAHAFGQADGSLGRAYIDTPGAGYESAPTVQAANFETPTTAEFDVASLSDAANPICAALTPVLNQLMAHAVVESAGTDQQTDVDWRETIQSERIIAVSGPVRVMDPDDPEGDILFKPLAPRVLGIAVRRDHEKGAPGHSWANQPVQGIVGPGRDMEFSITDGANEGQELLGANIGIVVRGEVGNEFAIASGGFVFVGTDNCGEDDLWRFYNVTRMRDYIHLGMLRTLRFYLGRYNIVAHTIQAVLNTMGFFLRDLQADDHILGYRMTFTSASNSAEEIRKGHLTVGFKAEEPPVLRKIVVESRRYAPAIDTMISRLEAQLNLAL